MTFLELLAILRVAGEITEYAANLIAALHSQGRDPTPQEIADVKAKQAAAEAAWAAGSQADAAAASVPTTPPSPAAPVKAAS